MSDSLDRPATASQAVQAAGRQLQGGQRTDNIGDLLSLMKYGLLKPS